MGKRLKENEKQDIINRYNEGQSPSQIAKIYGIYNNSVNRIIKKSGIEANRITHPTEEQINEMVSQYMAGVSSEIIADKLGFNSSTVCRNLKRKGVVLRPPTQNKRKYAIKEDFFENIDSEEKAYFLGFIYADGNLSKKNHNITITLQESDRDILEKFYQIIYEKPKKLLIEQRTLGSGEVRNYLTASVYCQKMHQDLIKQGSPPAKTFIIRFPNNQIVPTDLIWHFVRGYFDGDGCISIANPSHPVVDFSSNIEFITDLIPFLQQFNLKCNKMSINKENNKSAYVQLTGNQNIINLYNLLYNNANIYMNRKYMTFNKLFSFINDKKKQSILKSSNIEKYGTTYIPTWKGILLTSANLKTLSETDKQEIAEYLLTFYRENGFPYTKLTADELIKDFTSLKNTLPTSILDGKQLTLYNQSGNTIFKHFSPHFFEVKCGTDINHPSMLETFNDDDLLRKTILNRLNDNFNMTGNMIKQGLANSRLAFKASIFNPTVAKCLYSLFGQEGSIIYDYSMGFGQRLTGFLSLPWSMTYLGADPWEKSYNSNQEIYNFISNKVPGLNKKVELNCIGSENYCPTQYMSKVDLAFSSPPYYNLETYCNENNQAYSQGYDGFINQWWKLTASNINKLLTKNGKFIINVKENVDGFNLAEDMINVAKDFGFEVKDTYYLKLNRNATFKNIGYKLEPIFILERN